ncbi:MAG: hypothetical protein R3D43_12455 [Tepidamorphaceae bacterium]
MRSPKSAKPVAFVGKGVVFDTGGISIKPAASMEDMKGDMAGTCDHRACTRLQPARPRSAPSALSGLVENMPDGAAQRPGDIVLSGTTIEIINTPTRKAVSCSPMRNTIRSTASSRSSWSSLAALTSHSGRAREPTARRAFLQR